ncbi:MAG: ABC transporter substrate-binding protein [Clostridiales bacterium]|jgi:peptide/nickel transport system substrate-binding protein|nr:ABC transporter substrate-binding protein [Clostridiales bacterium]
MKGNNQLGRVLAVLIVLVTFAGCVNNSASTQQPSTQTEINAESNEPADESTAPTEAPPLAQAKTDLIVALGMDTETMDPAWISSTTSLTILNHIFEPLFGLDEGANVVAVLAEDGTMIDDLTWEIKLRQGIKFHSGADFNSEAVRVTFDRWFNEASNIVVRYKEDINFESLEVVDDYTVRIHNTKPCPTLLYNLMPFLIADPTMYDGVYEPVQGQASGTGPYKFVEWKRDDHFAMEINTDYWQGESYFKTLTFRSIPEASTRVSELLAGSVDVIQNPPIDQIEKIETENTKVIVAPPGRDCALIINCALPPFDDVRVRQALNYAIDKDAINNALLAGKGEMYAGICLPPNENKDFEPYPYDLVKARELLDAAGVPEGLEITLETTTGRYVREKEVTQAVAAELDKIGFKTKVELLDYSIQAQRRDSRTTGALNFIGLGGYFSGVGELNWPRDIVSQNGWFNDEYEEKYEAIKSEMNPAAYQQLLKDCQQIAHDDAPWLYLWRQPSYYGAIKGLNWAPYINEFMLFRKATYSE